MQYPSPGQLLVTEQPSIRQAPPLAEAGLEAAVFEQRFHEVARSGYLLARQLGRGADEAADVAQEAALRAWRYRHTCRGDFRPWFLAIVYRQARTGKPRWLTLPLGGARELIDPPPSILDPDLSAALRRLPPRQRAALWLRYAEDMSTAATAQALGTSETAIKQLLLRARESLRRQLSVTSSEKEAP